LLRGVVVQRLDDGTLPSRSGALARRDELLESLLHRREPTDSPGNVRDFADRHRAHRRAAPVRVLTKLDQLADVAEAEAQLLRA
jgi:hypothetical protein